jgi:hypothetical protein
LFIKHLSHHRSDWDIAHETAGDRPDGQLRLGYGLISAVVGSAGIHFLAALLFWFGCRGNGRDGRLSSCIIDTRVKEPKLEVGVCLRLLDSPSPNTEPNLAIKPNAVETKAGPTEAANTDLSANIEPRIASAKPANLLPSQETPSFSGDLHSMSPPVSMQTKSRPGAVIGESKNFGSATFFEIETRAKSIVYVIDRSVSMGPNGKLARAKRELLRSLEQLPADARFQIILFNRSVEILNGDQGMGLLRATLENRRRAAQFFSSALSEGGTLPVPALKRALTLKPDVIFFLSDAEDMNDRDVREITHLNAGRTEIQVVVLEEAHHEKQNSVLSMLAHSNRGKVRSVAESPMSTSSPGGN